MGDSHYLSLKQQLKFALSGLSTRDLEQTSTAAARAVLREIRLHRPQLKAALQDILTGVDAVPKHAARSRLHLAEYAVLECTCHQHLMQLLPSISQQALVILAAHRKDAACINSLAALLSGCLAKLLHEPDGSYAAMHCRAGGAAAAPCPELITAEYLWDAILSPAIKSTYRDPEHARVSSGSVVVLGLVEVLKTHTDRPEVVEALRRSLALMLQLMAQGSVAQRVPGVFLPVCSCVEVLGLSLDKEATRRLLKQALKAAITSNTWQVRRDACQVLAVLGDSLQARTPPAVGDTHPSNLEQDLLRTPAVELLIANKPNVLQVLEDIRYDKIAAVRSAAASAWSAFKELPDPAPAAADDAPAGGRSDRLGASSSRRSGKASMYSSRPAKGTGPGARSPHARGRPPPPRFVRPKMLPDAEKDFGVLVFAPKAPPPPAPVSSAPAEAADTSQAHSADQASRPVARQLLFDDDASVRGSVDAASQTVAAPAAAGQQAYSVQSPLSTRSHPFFATSSSLSPGQGAEQPDLQHQLLHQQLQQQLQQQSGLPPLLAGAGFSSSPVRIDVSHHVHGRVELGISYSADGSPAVSRAAAAAAAATSHVSTDGVAAPGASAAFAAAAEVMSALAAASSQPGSPGPHHTVQTVRTVCDTQEKPHQQQQQQQQAWAPMAGEGMELEPSFGPTFVTVSATDAAAASASQGLADSCEAVDPQQLAATAAAAAGLEPAAHAGAAVGVEDQPGAPADSHPAAPAPGEVSAASGAVSPQGDQGRRQRQRWQVSPLSIGPETLGQAGSDTSRTAAAPDVVSEVMEPPYRQGTPAGAWVSPRSPTSLDVLRSVGQRVQHLLETLSRQTSFSSRQGSRSPVGPRQVQVVQGPPTMAGAPPVPRAATSNSTGRSSSVASTLAASSTAAISDLDGFVNGEQLLEQQQPVAVVQDKPDDAPLAAQMQQEQQWAVEQQQLLLEEQLLPQEQQLQIQQDRVPDAASAQQVQQGLQAFSPAAASQPCQPQATDDSGGWVLLEASQETAGMGDVLAATQTQQQPTELYGQQHSLDEAAMQAGMSLNRHEHLGRLDQGHSAVEGLQQEHGPLDGALVQEHWQLLQAAPLPDQVVLQHPQRLCDDLQEPPAAAAAAVVLCEQTHTQQPAAAVSLHTPLQQAADKDILLTLQQQQLQHAGLACAAVADVEADTTAQQQQQQHGPDVPEISQGQPATTASHHASPQCGVGSGQHQADVLEWLQLQGHSLQHIPLVDGPMQPEGQAGSTPPPPLQQEQQQQYDDRQQLITAEQQELWRQLADVVHADMTAAQPLGSTSQRHNHAHAGSLATPAAAALADAACGVCGSVSGLAVEVDQPLSRDDDAWQQAVLTSPNVNNRMADGDEQDTASLPGRAESALEPQQQQQQQQPNQPAVVAARVSQPTGPDVQQVPPSTEECGAQQADLLTQIDAQQVLQQAGRETAAGDGQQQETSAVQELQQYPQHDAAAQLQEGPPVLGCSSPAEPQGMQAQGQAVGTRGGQVWHSNSSSSGQIQVELQHWTAGGSDAAALEGPAADVSTLAQDAAAEVAPAGLGAVNTSISMQYNELFQPFAESQAPDGAMRSSLAVSTGWGPSAALPPSGLVLLPSAAPGPAESTGLSKVNKALEKLHSLRSTLRTISSSGAGPASRQLSAQASLSNIHTESMQSLPLAELSHTAVIAHSDLQPALMQESSMQAVAAGLAAAGGSAAVGSVVSSQSGAGSALASAKDWIKEISERLQQVGMSQALQAPPTLPQPEASGSTLVSSIASSEVEHKAAAAAVEEAHMCSSEPRSGDAVAATSSEAAAASPTALSAVVASDWCDTSGAGAVDIGTCVEAHVPIVAPTHSSPPACRGAEVAAQPTAPRVRSEVVVVQGMLQRGEAAAAAGDMGVQQQRQVLSPSSAGWSTLTAGSSGSSVGSEQLADLVEEQLLGCHSPAQAASSISVAPAAAASDAGDGGSMQGAITLSPSQQQHMASPTVASAGSSTQQDLLQQQQQQAQELRHVQEQEQLQPRMQLQAPCSTTSAVADQAADDDGAAAAAAVVMAESQQRLQHMLSQAGDGDDVVLLMSFALKLDRLGRKFRPHGQEVPASGAVSQSTNTGPTWLSPGCWSPTRQLRHHPDSPSCAASPLGPWTCITHNSLYNASPASSPQKQVAGSEAGAARPASPDSSSAGHAVGTTAEVAAAASSPPGSPCVAETLQSSSRQSAGQVVEQQQADGGDGWSQPLLQLHDTVARNCLGIGLQQLLGETDEGFAGVAAVMSRLQQQLLQLQDAIGMPQAQAGPSSLQPHLVLLVQELRLELRQQCSMFYARMTLQQPGPPTNAIVEQGFDSLAETEEQWFMQHCFPHVLRLTQRMQEQEGRDYL